MAVCVMHYLCLIKWKLFWKNITYQDVITNLNILDYEYYFKITEYFMQEDASSVLTAFNEIINNGFDGEMFMLELPNIFVIY